MFFLNITWKIEQYRFYCENRLFVFILVKKMTRTEGISVRVIRMLCQLVGFGPVEQLNVKFTKKCMRLMQILMLSCLGFTRMSITNIPKLSRKPFNFENDRIKKRSIRGNFLRK